jgi:hypothetical protein
MTDVSLAGFPCVVVEGWVIEVPVDSASTDTSAQGATVEKRAAATAHAAAWLLLVTFVALLLSVAVPAMTEATRGDVAAALFFMLGLAAFLAGTGGALVSSVSTGRTLFGALVVLVGLVGLYGVIPSVAALAVVLLGVAIEIGSLPDD